MGVVREHVEASWESEDVQSKDSYPFCWFLWDNDVGSTTRFLVFGFDCNGMLVFVASRISSDSSDQN